MAGRARGRVPGGVVGTRWLRGCALLAALLLLLALPGVLGRASGRAHERATSVAVLPPDRGGPDGARRSVSLPGGVRLDVPAAAPVGAADLRLVAVPTPAILADLPLDGPVRRLDFCAPLALPAGTVLDVPVAGAAATLLVRSPLGFWIPLPAARGAGRLRVAIDGVPTPWVFALVRGADTSGYAPPASRAHLEQVAWLDAAALPAALDARRARTPARPRLDLLPAAEARGGAARPAHGVDLLDEAVECFYRARAALRIEDGARAWTHYRDGIGKLAAAKAFPQLYKLDYGLVEEGDPRWPVGVARSRKAHVVLESLCAGFAPWGIDLLHRMLEEDANLLQHGFDVRVCPPLGQQPWGDALLAPRGKASRSKGPWDTELGALVRAQGLVPQQAKRSVVLRLYSPRVLEEGMLESILRWTKDWVCRWGPVVAGLWTGGLSGATVPLLWAGVDIAVGWVEEAFDAGSVEYLGFETGKNVTTVTLDMVMRQDEATLRLLGWKTTTGILGRRLALLDMGLALALAWYRWDPGKIRALAAAAPPGYKLGEDGTVFAAEHPKVPPVVLIGWVDGPFPPEGAVPAYTRGAKANRVWAFDYGRLYRRFAGDDGLHETIERGPYEGLRTELRGDLFGRRGAGVPWPEILRPLEADWLPGTTCTTAPREQAIGFELRSDVLAQMATARNLATPWDQVDIESLAVRGVLEVPEATPVRHAFPLVEVATRRHRRAARRFVLRLTHEDHAPTPDGEAPWTYRAGATLALPRLLERYTIVVEPAAGGRAWAQIPVDFDARQAQRVRLERTSDDTGWIWGDGGTEEVSWHLLEVRAPSRPRFTSAIFNMEMPYRYRVTGSLVESSEERQGRAFRARIGREIALDWKDGRALWSTQSGGVEEQYALRMAEEDTLVSELSFRQVGADGVESTRFVLTDLPLVFSRRLEGTDLEVRFFGVRDEAVRDHVGPPPPPRTFTVTETHPETREKVQVTVTTTMSALGVPPPDGDACFVALLLANKTETEIQTLVEGGTVARETLDRFQEDIQKALQTWWRR